MANRSNGGIKRWMGFKDDESNSSMTSSTTTSSTSSGNFSSAVTGTGSAPVGGLERIRELESQLSDLRSRRDITALSREEFEILATETAMTLIRTAQQRESKAQATAERLIAESQRSARSALEAAEAKAKNLLSQAESRGRRLIDAAEGDAAEIVEGAKVRGEEVFNARKREAVALTSAAKKEAEQMIADAAGDVATFRQWLSELTNDAERLYRVQLTSLDSATKAIEDSRSRLDQAWQRLSQLGVIADSQLDENGKPIPRRPSSRSADENESSSSKATSARSSTRKRKPGTGKSGAGKSATRRSGAKTKSRSATTKRKSR